MTVFGRLVRDRRGNAAIMLAGGLSALLATASLGVDAGNFFVEKRRLQGIADAAAMAAVDGPGQARARAEAVLAATPGAPVALTSFDTGGYAADPAVAPSDRFALGSGTGAVRVTVTGHAPSFFARALGFHAATPITAQATAARADLAAFSIGSRLAGVEGGAANALLSALAGTDLRLSVLDYRALVGARVDLFRFIAALRTELRLDGVSFADILAGEVRLPQVLGAAALATDDPVAAAALRAMAGRVPGTVVRLANLIDLGPAGNGLRAELAPPVAVDAFALLRATLELAGGARQVATDIDLGVPGLASTRVRLAVGARVASSPWLAIDRAGQAVVRTGQARLHLDTQLAGAAPLGLGPIRVPILVELAPAEARLSAIACAGRPARASVTLAATPSVGRLAIADIDPAGFGDFARPLTVRPATLVRLPLVTVSGQAEVRLGQRTREVAFDAGAIAAHAVRTVSTDDLAGSIAADLIERMGLTVSVAGLGLNVGMITAALAPVLAAAAPALDLALARTTALAGLGIGQIDLWVDGVRCGTPMLVG